MKKGQEKQGGWIGFMMFTFSFVMLMQAVSTNISWLKIFAFVMCALELIYGIYCVCKWKKWKAQNKGEDTKTEQEK